MALIHQKDIIQYLNKDWGLKYSQKQICDILQPKVNASLASSRLSEISNGKRKGMDYITAEQLFQLFVVPSIEGKSDDTLDGMLKKLIEHFQQNGIEFLDVQGRENETYQDYVMRMLEQGVPNIELVKGDTPSASAVSKATLHPQNIRIISNFTGREELLSQIDAHLSEYHTAILSGIGGIGKTYLANYYASLHEDDYQAIQYINSNQEVERFEQLLLQLQFDNLDEKEWGEDDKLKKRLSYLKKTTASTLIIFDNLDHLPKDMSAYQTMLCETNIHILITTRLTRGFPEKAMINVPPLPRSQQLKLFEFHLGYEVDPEDQEIVNQILDQIGGHTLLIELVAKSIYQGELDYSVALEQLLCGDDTSCSPSVMISKDEQVTEDRLWHFVRNILFSTMPLSDAQRNTMRLLSLLPTDGISRKLFFKLDDQAINTLPSLEQESWSIMVREGKRKFTRLHPVIREVIHSELIPTTENCSDFLCRLCHVIQSDEAQQYIADLSKLICSIAGTLSFRTPANPGNIDTLCTMAAFLNKNYHYSDALKLYQAALDVWNDAPSAQDLETPYKLHTNVGKLHQRLAQYAKAIGQFQSAIDYTEEGSETRAKSYRNLGEVYRKDSNYAEALKYDTEAMKLMTNPNQIAEVNNAIGVVYLNMGSAAKSEEQQTEYYTMAKDYYSKALQLWTDNQEPPTNLAFCTHNIGTAYHRLKDYKSAVTYHKDALKIREDNNLDQTYIASSHVWLAQDYMAMGDYDHAKTEIDLSLDIRRKLLGENHPDYAWSLSSLSDWYERTGDLPNALKAAEKSYRIRTNVLGEDHEYTKQARNKLMKLREMLEEKG